MSYSLCCVVEWHIVNFKSFCDTKASEGNEGFYSEKFVIGSLHNSSWFLKCHRKGKGGPDVFALRRSNDIPEQKNIHVKFDISLRDDKGISILKDEPKICNFDVNDEIGSLLFPEQAKNSNQAENYSHYDVCLIRCQIFKLEEEPVVQVIQFFLKTHLPVKKYVFDWFIIKNNNYSPSKTLCIVSPLGKEKIFSFTISYGYSNSVRVGFSGKFNVNKFSWQCDIFCHKTKTHFLKICEDFPALTFERSYSPLNYLENSLIRDHNGDRVCTCELSIILHEEMIATYVSPKLESILHDVTNENDIQLIPKSKTPPRSSLKSDIVRLYHKGIMSDFSVKVKDSEFPVHSIILASRSAIFQTMLETNMKEKRDKVLKLDDMDENVVRRFLDYLYTDDPGEMTVDLALELYRLAHLYEIVGLKEDSASFLKQNINTSNIGDIIVLSDRHEDEGLKSAAVQFIFYHEKEVLLCKEFQDFAKSNSQLTVDIFFKLSEIKLK